MKGGKRGTPNPRAIDGTYSATSLGLQVHVYLRLQLFRVPHLFFHLLQECAKHNQRGGLGKLDCVEYFCGVVAISSSFDRSGLRAVGFDLARTSRMNINTADGFIKR